MPGDNIFYAQGLAKRLQHWAGQEKGRSDSHFCGYPKNSSNCFFRMGINPIPTKISKRVEERQGLKIAWPEEIAFRMGFIDAQQVCRVAEPLKKSGYDQYLMGLVE